jgi:ribosome-binding factor A
MSRMEKLNQQFKREIGNMILMGEISDPRVKFVTITYADISKDLTWAHIGFSVLADDPRTVQAALEGLNSARGRVRKLLSERFTIRHMPEIKFVYDKTIADFFKMALTLEEIRRERESREGAGAGEEPASDKGETEDTLQEE